MPPRKSHSKTKTQNQVNSDDGADSGSKATRATPFFQLLHLWVCFPKELDSNPEWARVWSLPGPNDADAHAFFSPCPTHLLNPDVTWEAFLNSVRAHVLPTTAYRETNNHPVWSSIYNWLKKYVEQKYKLMKNINKILEQGLVDTKHDVFSVIRCYSRGRPAYACPMPKSSEFSTAQAPVLQLIMGDFAFAEGSATIANRNTTPFWSSFLTQYLERANKGRARASAIREKAFSIVLADLPDGYLESPPDLTVARVKSLIRSCDDFARAAGWCEELPQNQKISERLGFLEGIMQNQVKLPGTATSSRARGFSRGQQITFKATPAEIEEISGIVEDWHRRLRDDISAGPSFSDLDLPDVESGSELWAGLPDLGVEKFASVDEEKLCELLGYQHRRPPTFAAYRNKDGLDGWTAAPNISTQDSSNTEIHLLWHQLVGICAILDRIFSVEAGSALGAFPGVLLADEVGLGKTAICMAVMCMAADVCSGRCPTLPPLLQNRFFAGCEVLPNKPMLVIVPGALLQQWPSELRTFIRPHALDIFIYPTADAQWMTFWNKFDESKQPLCRRVVIVASSTLQRQAGMYSTIYGKGLPETLCAHKRGRPVIWAQDWSLVVADEAHAYRTPTSGLSRAFNIVAQYSHVCLASTATPLYQKPSDLLTIGRLLRLAHCRGEPAHTWQRSKELEIARLRRTAFKKASVDAASSARFHGNSYPKELEEYRLNAMNYVTGIKERFADRIIRRNGQSSDCRGERLQRAIAPMLEINAHLDLEDWEISSLSGVMKGLKDTRRVVENSITDNFFLRYRLGSGYIHPSVDQDPHAPKLNRYPRVASMEEWESRKGSKINALAALCVYALLAQGTAPRVPPLENDTLTKDFLKNIPVIPPDFPVRRKIVVYHEFCLLTELIESVLSLYGVTVWKFTGEQSKGKRDSSLAAWKASKTGGVLLMTNIGSEGINMTEADTLISFDMFWSMVQDRQLRGRVYRMGQEKEVVVVRLIANKTMDVRLGHGGNVKADMLERFYQKKILDVDESESEDSEDEDSQTRVPTEVSKTILTRAAASTSKASPPAIAGTHSLIAVTTSATSEAPGQITPPLPEPAKIPTVIAATSPRPDVSTLTDVPSDEPRFNSLNPSNGLEPKPGFGPAPASVQTTTRGGVKRSQPQETFRESSQPAQRRRRTNKPVQGVLESPALIIQAPSDETTTTHVNTLPEIPEEKFSHSVSHVHGSQGDSDYVAVENTACRDARDD